jgi:glucosamine--fructose-6-phosphate aminotransferase (isomerizing)
MSHPTNSATYAEIVSQPEALAGAIRAVEAESTNLHGMRQPYERTIFTGCGSTYYLSLAAAAVFQRLTGATASGIPAGELMLAPQEVYPPQPARTLLVAVSRSGATTETVRAVRHFLQHTNGDVITITCQPDNELSRLGRLNIHIPEAQERSIAQTRAFSAMWIAVCALAGLWADDEALLDTLRRVPDLSQPFIASLDGPMQRLGGNLSLDRIYFLGSGLRYGLACEGSLKMKEMSLTHSEPFHFLEFRHGPQSMVNETTLVVALMGDDPQGYEAEVVRDVQSLGAQALVLSASTIYELSATQVGVAPGLDEVARSVLYLPPLQLLALGRAAAKGLNPDMPHNLSAVVVLDET